MLLFLFLFYTVVFAQNIRQFDAGSASCKITPRQDIKPFLDLCNRIFTIHNRLAFSLFTHTLKTTKMVLNAAFNKSIYANEMNFSLIVQIKMISLTMIHCDLYNILRQIKKKMKIITTRGRYSAVLCNVHKITVQFYEKRILNIHMHGDPNKR